MSDPLASAKGKVRWAKDHLKVFDKDCERFLEKEPFRFYRECGPQAYEQIFRFKPRATPPSDLSLLAGDILHNARSALDHAVYGLSLDHAPTLSDSERRSLQFPIVRDVTEFKQQKGRGRLMGVPAKQRTQIQRLQPYHSGWPNVWLEVLSRLNNTDKHRFIHVVAGAVGWAAHSRDGTSVGHEPVLTWPKNPYLTESNAEIVRISFAPPKPNVYVEFSPSWVLAIEAGQIPIGPIDSAYDTLEHIVAAVDEVLNRLENGPSVVLI